MDIQIAAIAVNVQYGSSATHRTAVSVEMNTTMQLCVTIKAKNLLF